MKVPERGQYSDYKKAVLALPYSKADEHVFEEKGLILPDGTCLLEWMPVRPGLFHGKVSRLDKDTDAVCLYDDGDGNLHVYAEGIVATLNYITGRIQFKKPQVWRHAEYVFEYFFDSDYLVRVTYTMKLTSAPQCPF